MSQPFSILVVCLGNICRSPLVERLLRVRLDAPDAFRVSSAGVRAVVGAPMDELAAAELRRLGGDPDGAAARQLRPPMATDADLVLVATRALRSRVLEEAPRALKRTFTVLETAALLAAPQVAEPPADPGELVARAARWRADLHPASYDVADPIGRSAQVHREVADELDRACTTIAGALASAPGRTEP